MSQASVSKQTLSAKSKVIFKEENIFWQIKLVCTWVVPHQWVTPTSWKNTSGCRILKSPIRNYYRDKLWENTSVMWTKSHFKQWLTGFTPLTLNAALSHLLLTINMLFPLINHKLLRGRFILVHVPGLDGVGRGDETDRTTCESGPSQRKPLALYALPMSSPTQYTTQRSQHRRKLPTEKGSTVPLVPS